MRAVPFLCACAVAVILAACAGDSGTSIDGTYVADPVPAANVSSSNQPAKFAFGAVRSASGHAPAAVGSYARGCAAGSVQLPETGPTWQAMRLSRNRNWGHPELVSFVQDLSRQAARQPGWNGLYVGDLSQPRGGPMLTGHNSHQIGLDADIWMLPATNLNLTPAERESVSSISAQRASGAYVNSNWTRQHHEIIKAAAQDSRTARIFVFAGAKVQMCNDETGDRRWLAKVRPWWGHHYHFHVRLNCPRGQRDCENQAAPPPGDGCAEAQEWVNNILNPRPAPRDPSPAPAVRRGELVLADLPGQCAAVLQPR